MTIHDMITKWIQEVNREIEEAKKNLDLHKLVSLESLKKKLKLIRDGK